MNTSENVVPKKNWQRARKLASQRLRQLEGEMERKAKEEIPKAKERLLFLKWESLRRNRNYLDFYSRAYPLYLKPANRNGLSYNIASHEIEQKYLKKFGLTIGLRDVPHPDTPFEKLKWKEIFDLKAVQCWESEYRLGLALKPDLSNVEEFFKNPQRIPDEELARRVNIKVEINLLYSKTEILRELVALLKKWIKRKKTFGCHPRKIAKDDAQKYFECYDMHTKGMSFPEIAEVVFPSQKRPRSVDKRNYEKLVNDYYHNAKGLIMGSMSVGN